MSTPTRFEEAKQAASDYTGQVSTLVRSFTLSAIAIVWVLAGQKVSGLDRPLLRPLLFLTIALFFDFLQYLWMAIWWVGFVLWQERKLDRADEAKVQPSETPVNVGHALWGFKVVLFVIGFGVLLSRMSQGLPH